MSLDLYQPLNLGFENGRVLSLVLTKVECIDETEHEGVWPFVGEGIANDAIRLMATLTTKGGDQNIQSCRTPIWDLGSNYQDGTVVAYERELLAVFVPEGGPFPFTATTALLLVEEDYGGINWDEIAGKVVSGAADALRSNVRPLIVDVAGKVILGSIGGIFGLAAGALFDAVLAGLLAIGSDLFPAVETTVRIPDANSVLEGDVQSFQKVFEGHGGKYELTLEWRLSDPRIGKKRLHHAIRRPQDWESAANVEQFAGDFGSAKACSAAQIGDDLHVCVVTAEGRLLHSIRDGKAGIWQAFRSVEDVVGGVGSRFVDVSAANVAGDLHLCALTEDGIPWHTIRHTQRLAWDPFGDIRAQLNDNSICRRVACAPLGSDLYFCAATGEGRILNSARIANTGVWLRPHDVGGAAGERGFIRAVSAASDGTRVHLSAVNSAGDLYHSIREPDGRWANFGSVEDVRAAGDSGIVVGVATAMIGVDLHVLVCTDRGDLSHTIRHPQSWDRFGNVKAQVGDPGTCIRVATASFGEELHCLVIAS